MHSLDHDSVLLGASPGHLPVWQTFQCTYWVLTHKTPQKKNLFIWRKHLAIMTFWTGLWNGSSSLWFISQVYKGNDIHSHQVDNLYFKFTKAMKVMCNRAAEMFLEFWSQTPPLSLTQNVTAYQFLGPYNIVLPRHESFKIGDFQANIEIKWPALKLLCCGITML